MVAVVILTFVGFEAGSNLLYWTETGKLYLLAERPPPASVAPGIVSKLHPYFGFMNVYSPAALAAAGLQHNNYEFPQVARYIAGLHGCCDFPIRAEDNKDKYIIAIFGNSIAQGIGQGFQGQDPQSELMRRLSKLPAAAGKRVIVLNLALGGHKQPQELMTLSYLLAGGSHFDTVLYLSTVNEPIASLANVQSQLTPDFPTASLWINLSVSLDRLSAAGPGALLGTFALRRAQATQAQIEACETASCVIVHRPLLQIERWISQALLTNEQQDALNLPHFVSFPTPVHPAGPSKYDDIIEQWAQANRMMAALTRLQGGTFMQVIMPTPWVHPTHHLPWEMDQSVPALYGPDAPLALQKMIEAGKELQHEGIRVVDATHLMDRLPLDASNKLYLDYSGHLGPLGMETMLNYTVDQLLQSNPS
jgi:hypothetical protein